MNIFLAFLVLCFVLGGNGRFQHNSFRRNSVIILGLSLLLTAAYFFLNQL